MNRVALAIALASAWVLSLPAAADEYDPTLGWQTRRGALICGNYFAINDGEAAARKGDEKWLKEVDCLIVNGGLKLTIIQEAPFASDTDIWRARLQPPNGGQDVT